MNRTILVSLDVGVDNFPLSDRKKDVNNFGCLAKGMFNFYCTQ